MANFVGTGAGEYISSYYGVSSGVISDPLNSRPSDAVDTIYGNGGNDNIDGGGGNDIIYTGAGNDTAYGGAGDDLFDDYTDSSFGGSDTFYGGVGSDTIYGWTGYDTLYGEAGDDSLYGEGDDDTLDGGIGADRMYGGDGSDTYYVDNVGDLVEDDGSGYGYDRVNSAVTFSLGAGLEALTLVGRLDINGTGNDLGNSITGNARNNSLYGLAGSDSLSGEAGADILEGGDGDDFLDGGSGADAMYGGRGDDTYRVDSASDVVVETLFQSQGGGIDTVNLEYAPSSYTLGTSVENLQMSWDSGNQNATGNVLGNVIYGGSGANQIRGLEGNDVLHGYEGADILDGGTGVDTMYGGYAGDTYLVDQSTDRAIEYAWEEGMDIVNATASFTLGANVEDLTLVGSANINGTGNSGANLLSGSTGANTLRGLGGADTFRSQSGADIVIGGTGADVFQYQGVQGSNPAQRDVIRAGDGATAFQGAGAAAGDRFDLSQLDAVSATQGVQDFVFGTATGRGRLWATTVGTQTYINGNTDTDAVIEFQVAIDDGAVRHTAYTAADFLL